MTAHVFRVSSFNFNDNRTSDIFASQKNKFYIMTLTLIAFHEDFLSSLRESVCPGDWGNVRAIDLTSRYD